jgi:hypothetical protein
MLNNPNCPKILLSHRCICKRCTLQCFVDLDTKNVIVVVNKKNIRNVNLIVNLVTVIDEANQPGNSN